MDIYGPHSIRHNDRFLIAQSDLNNCIALAQNNLDIPAVQQLVIIYIYIYIYIFLIASE